MGVDVQALEDNASQKIRFLRLFTKGTCHLAASIDKNVHVAGETVQIYCSVNNTSKKNVRFIRVRLYEDTTAKVGNRWEHKNSRVVCEKEFPGIAAGQSIEQALTMKLLNSSTKAPINPSTAIVNHAAVNSGNEPTVRCQYRLSIRCKVPFCPSVRLNFPVTIVRGAIDAQAHARPLVQIDTVREERVLVLN